MDSCFTNSDLVIGNLFFTYFFSLSFFFSLSDKVEKGRFFPEPSAPYLSKASFFCISSRSFILKTTFLFSLSSSAIAQSILSPPVNRDGLASAALIAIWDFLICKSSSQPSGLTVRLLLSVEMILTVTVWLTFLSLNQSNGSGWVCL